MPGADCGPHAPPWRSGDAIRSDPHSEPVAAFALVPGGSAAYPPGADVEKVEPPNWWAGHSINPVRVLIRGKNLTGARVDLRPPNVRRRRR